jgi:hypothetical protein
MSEQAPMGTKTIVARSTRKFVIRSAGRSRMRIPRPILNRIVAESTITGFGDDGTIAGSEEGPDTIYNAEPLGPHPQRLGVFCCPKQLTKRCLDWLEVRHQMALLAKKETSKRSSLLDFRNRLIAYYMGLKCIPNEYFETHGLVVVSNYWRK